MKATKFLYWADPYKQSVFYFKTDLVDWVIFFAVCIFIYKHRFNIWVLCLLYNPLFAYPNIYIHSLFGHMFLGPLAQAVFTCLFAFILPATVVDTIGKLLLVSAGSLSEFVAPLIGIMICLHTAGGRYVLAVMWYWLAVAVFSMGAYIVKPSIQTDLLAYNPPNGDWVFILDTLGLQAYTEPIGNALIFLAISLFVLAVWSPFYYWRHMDQYPIPYCEFW